MRTVQPLTGAAEITLAVSQAEYEPLTVACYFDTDLGSVVLLSRWKPSDEERERIAAGEDIYLALCTFGGAPQPARVQVGDFGYRADAPYLNLEPVPQRESE